MCDDSDSAEGMMVVLYKRWMDTRGPTWQPGGNLAELSSDKSAVHRGLFSITHECGWSAWQSFKLAGGVMEQSLISTMFEIYKDY